MGVVSPEMAQRLGGELLSLSPDLIMSVGSPRRESVTTGDDHCANRFHVRR
jgi:hypothetical protein